MTTSAVSAADRELIERARNGQKEAGDELARRHRNSAYFFALQLTGNPDQALDLSQDAMLRFFTHLGRFDSSRPVRPWLFTVIRNRARDLWRRKKVRKTESWVTSEGEDLLEQVQDPAHGPHELLAKNELRRRLWLALGQLSRINRETLVLRDYQDLSYAEIAAVLDIPKGTVMSRLHAARKSLREAYLDQGVDGV